jgi:hypothetical protein
LFERHPPDEEGISGILLLTKRVQDIGLIGCHRRRPE